MEGKRVSHNSLENIVERERERERERENLNLCDY